MNAAPGATGEAVVRARVVIVDDHVSMLMQVAQVLEEEFNVAAVVTDAESLIAIWAEVRPDVIVLDISLPRATGLEAAINLRSQGCDAAIVFFSVHQSFEIVRAAWAAGGLGYVAKRDLGTALLPAVRAALRGEQFVSASIDLR